MRALTPVCEEHDGMLKVFLVDDDAVVNSGLRKLIPWQELNASVIGDARNGRAAFAQIVEMRPDLVITDIRMPIMDGLELCQKIHEEMADTSIILLSAYEDFVYAKTALKYDVKDYILKPIDQEKINQLIAIIDKISKRMDKRNRLYSGFADSMEEKRLIEAVVSMDEEYIRSFLEEKFSFFNEDTELTTELCFKLISTILHIANKLNINPEVCGVNKNAVVDRLFSLKSANEKKGYTLQIYLDIIQHIKRRKGERLANVVDEITAYIQSSFTNPDLTVSSIADRFNKSSVYLNTIFHQVKGTSIGSYICELRLHKAKLLLRSHSLSISEVCKASGYSDVHYFSKAFKKTEGLTPSAFRSIIYEKAYESV